MSLYNHVPIEDDILEAPFAYDDGLRFFCHSGADPDRPSKAARPDESLFRRGNEA